MSVEKAKHASTSCTKMANESKSLQLDSSCVAENSIFNVLERKSTERKEEKKKKKVKHFFGPRQTCKRSKSAFKFIQHVTERTHMLFLMKSVFG
jgi:hypothetical protein